MSTATLDLAQQPDVRYGVKDDRDGTLTMPKTSTFEEVSHWLLAFFRSNHNTWRLSHLCVTFTADGYEYLVRADTWLLEWLALGTVTMHVPAEPS